MGESWDKKSLLTDRFTPPFMGWCVNSYEFGREYSYPTEDGSDKNWGIHVGADTTCEQGTIVKAIGLGVCVYSGNHPGTSKDDRNWGGVVIVAHHYEMAGVHHRFYSLSGHLSSVHRFPGEIVLPGAVLGLVAEALTPSNGWWEAAHLHLGILADPKRKYRGGILPGYITPRFPFALEDWINPDIFLADSGKDQPWHEALERIHRGQ